MVDLLLGEDREALTSPAPVRTVYDPAAGTGGMLTIATDRMKDLNPSATVEVYGQELNPETWAIARSDLMLKETPPERMVLGNSLTKDGWAGERFDYMLANPPYGVDWKAYADPIKAEAARDGFDGRFGAGLPRISDGSFLFLQHMLSKMKPVADDPGTPWVDGGSRIAIVLSGSPLFSGAAGGGESEIRRWILENDWLEGIVALPDQMFYNTGISTYVWILTNRKADERRGLVTLVDARESGTKMRKSLGDKRKELTHAAIDEVNDLFDRAVEIAADSSDKRVKVMRNEEFGFQRIIVERPLRRRWGGQRRNACDRRGGQGGHEARPGRARRDARRARHDEVRSGDEREGLREAAHPGRGGARRKGEEGRAGGLRCAGPGCAGDHEEGRLARAGRRPARRRERAVARRLPGDGEDQRSTALVESAEQYLKDEVLPYVPDAWIDHTKTKIGYEIPFTRQFYVYTPPRPVAEINRELIALEEQIQEWMKGLAR